MKFKDLIIAHNGEVYNFQELREELIKKGYSFDSRTDTEVILKGYDYEGEKFFTKLNGIFAFIIYNKKRKELILFRDRLGIKPLYYYMDKEKLIISSEIKSFLENFSKEINFTENEMVVKEYFEKECISFESFIKEIKSINPGEIISYNLKTKKSESKNLIKVYDSINKEIYFKNSNKSKKRLIDELDCILNRVIKRQMISDAPVGTFCSGGLDSSLITAIAKKYNPNIKVYNVKVDDPIYDESPYAKMVADHLGLKFETITLNKDVFIANFKQCLYHEDTPLICPNGTGLFLIAKKAKKDGIKVLLSGEGADEVFAGYNRYRDFYHLLLAHNLNLFNKIDKVVWRLPYLFLKNKNSLVDYFISYNDINKGQSFISNKKRQIFREIYQRLSFIKKENKRLAISFQLMDIKNYLPHLLKRTDRMTMMASIEARVPFLDNEVLNFTLNLPFEYKVRGFTNKYLLKKVAERYLPKKIVYRGKRGFNFNYVGWMNTSSPKGEFYKEWKRNFNEK